MSFAHVPDLHDGLSAVHSVPVDNHSFPHSASESDAVCKQARQASMKVLAD